MTSNSTTLSSDGTPPRIDWKKKLEEHFAAAEAYTSRGADRYGQHEAHAALAQAAATALLAEAVERAVGAQTMSGVLQGLGSFFAGSSLSEKLARAMMVTPTDAEANQFFGERMCSCGKIIQAGAPLCHSVK